MSNEKCLVKDCLRSNRITAGYCSMHYARIRRHGSPDALRPNSIPIEQRFWAKVAITADINKCWEWQGGLSKSGYGQFTFGSENNPESWRAHRFAWFLIYKRKPAEFLLHSCDNRKCVNILHLREGTHQDNMQDMVDRNRQSKGIQTKSAKLTETDVLAIRKMSDSSISQREIARRFGVTQSVVWHVIHRKSWQHI
jgi:DNA-binding transcriptional regulator YiaG